MQTYWIAALAFGILVAIFAVQNSMPITIGFLWISMENVAVSVVILVSAALGAVITGLFGLGPEVRYRLRGRSSRRAVEARDRQIRELEETVERLTRERAEVQAKLDVYERAPADARPIPLVTVSDAPADAVTGADPGRGALGAGPDAEARAPRA
jgi:lipopolysaccharide assembly protein A